MNAPLAAGSVLADYSPVFREIFCPALRRFSPEVVLVSAGQDTLFDDPLGMMLLRPPDFEILAGVIAETAGVPLALVLEGGYSPSHGTAISHIFKGLQKNGTAGEMALPPPTPFTAGLIATLKKIHRL
jgi:acetoin utilization deacetylase AcuC-like enzyme